MTDKLDNFTADSLQNFIRTPPARSSILDEEMDLNAGKNPDQKSGIPRAKPRTARAERIGQILESVSTRPEQHPASQPQTQAAPIPGGGQGGGPGYHDAQVRQHMGELVRIMLQEGRNEDLATILQSHQTFITDVLAMIRSGQ
ncbi:MAG: hypothetical protein NXI24_12765 [bacterium]|nr:hypothetical protein [bacterium]